MKFIKGALFVFLVLGTLGACKKSTGEKAVTGAAQVVKEAVGKSYTVDLASSKVMWEGSKITSGHSGSISLSNGSLSAQGGQVTGGEFTIDMNSLVNSDMEAGQGKEKLEGHLKSADFFDVGTYPNAKFAITKITKIDGDAEASHLVYGNLTMKDASNEIGFKANISESNGTITVSTPKFTIDRTKWGLKYGSSSFFDNLGDKAINNEIDLQVLLTAKA